MLGTHKDMSKVNEIAHERIISLLRVSHDKLDTDEYQFIMDCNECLYSFPEIELQFDRTEQIKIIYLKYSN